MEGPPPDIKTYSTAAVIRTVWHWWGDRHLGLWIRIKNQAHIPHRYAQRTFDKGTKAIPWRLQLIITSVSAHQLFKKRKEKKSKTAKLVFFCC